jgi:release factor glutamine methyltransferase
VSVRWRTSFAVDNSADAVAIARENAHRHHVSNIEIKLSNWFSALEGRRFDVIVSNPPYVADRDTHLDHGDLRFEPSSALRGGDDGLDSVRTIIAGAPCYLTARGVLAIEHGYDQVASVRALLQSSGFVDIFTRKDLAGIERISGGKSTAAA